MTINISVAILTIATFSSDLACCLELNVFNNVFHSRLMLFYAANHFGVNVLVVVHLAPLVSELRF